MEDRHTQLWLGSRDGEPGFVGLPRDALLRHAMALGSSGSGKTVFCKVVVEECVRQGVPIIAIDPQGDIASLLVRGDPEQLRAHGIDPAYAEDFHRRAEVVVFTPASSAGIPLCADPLPRGIEGLAPAERRAALAQSAKTLTGLLGYEPGTDDGDGVLAVLELVLTNAWDGGRPIRDLDSLDRHFESLGKDGFKGLEKLLAPRKLSVVTQRLARLSVGSRRPLFQDGVPVAIETLLGTDSPAPSDRVRIAVIYLNTLSNQDDKDFFVATLVDRLYAWMLKNPRSQLSTLFYIDEVAPFLPPVRKPACKDGLTLLFKQARKYGVGCLMATQNPGDVDYRAMAQFGTWALGRMTTRQDIKKVEPTIKSLSPTHSDAVIQQLPSLKPGRFRLLSPDHFDAPCPLVTRWLFSSHETLDENRVERETPDAQRASFAALSKHAEPPPTEEPAAATPETISPTEPADAAPPKTKTTEPPAPTESPEPADAQPRSVPGPKPSSRDQELERAREMIGQRESVAAKDLAALLDVGEKKARTLLKTLVDRGEISSFKKGRAERYFVEAQAGRPDLGLPATVWTFSPHIGSEQVHQIAEGEARKRFLGVLGQDEHLDRAQLVYRPVIRVDFEEEVEAPLLSRLVRSRPDVRRGSVYFHGSTLSLCTFRPDVGIRFVDRVEDYASDVDDFDGVAHLAEISIAGVNIDEERYRSMRSGSDARARFRSLFRATPTGSVTLFVPTWELVFRVDGGRGYRVLWIDAIAGRPVEWP